MLSWADADSLADREAGSEPESAAAFSQRFFVGGSIVGIVLMFQEIGVDFAEIRENETNEERKLLM
jgi:hypothetical protein